MKILELIGNRLHHSRINKVISEDISPKYQDWIYDDYLEECRNTGYVRFIEPMTAKEDKTYLDRKYNSDDEIAELKRDGHRSLVYIGEESNRVFSRRVSKVTGWFKENSDQVPHIRDLLLKEFSGTVLDGEFDYGKTSKEVQSVMGALPETAINNQVENGWITFYAFDILYYKGTNIQSMPLWKRKVYLAKVIKRFQELYSYCHVEMLKMYVNIGTSQTLKRNFDMYIEEEDLLEWLDDILEPVDSYANEFARVVKQGMEGLIVKPIDHIYEQKRSKGYIKLKKQSTWDVIFMGLEPPTKEYSGKELESWDYYENVDGIKFSLSQTRLTEPEFELLDSDIPITKPYFMGWCGGIIFGVVKDNDLFQVGVCKGITDEMQEDLKHNWEKYAEEGRVFEVLAQEVIDKEKGSLRHPRFLGWRGDKSWDMCTFEDHIRR